MLTCSPAHQAHPLRPLAPDGLLPREPPPLATVGYTWHRLAFGGIPVRLPPAVTGQRASWCRPFVPAIHAPAIWRLAPDAPGFWS
jgi:hypothetical protein